MCIRHVATLVIISEKVLEERLMHGCDAWVLKRPSGLVVVQGASP